MDHSAGLLDRLQAALLEAVLRACGPQHAEAVGLKLRALVQPNKHWRKSGDYQSKIAESIFRSHVAALKRDTQESTEIMAVVTVSELGWAVERVYSSPMEVAESIKACIPEAFMTDLLADVVVDAPGGTLLITTAAHMQWHLSCDRHPCVQCGRFFQGPFGLRTHQVDMHGMEAQLVREKFVAHPWQMIIYTPPYSSRQEHSDVTEADCLCHALKSADAADGTYNAAGSTVIQRQCIEAAKIGDLKQLQVLLENNIMNGLEPVDVNACIDDDGNTLLTWAAGNGHLNMCRYLVEHLGMDPRAAGGKRRRWRQPVHWSARNGHTSLCQWLVEEKGVDIDASTENGTTPLHFAIWMGHFECVAWLVEVGHCDVNRRNQFGCNAAHWAAFRGDVKMLKYMFLHGLDFLHINKNLRSPLHKAAVKGNEEACMWLLKPLAEGGPGLGIAHMQPEIEGDTPITLARSIGHLQLEHNLRKKYEELSSALAICEYN